MSYLEDFLKSVTVFDTETTNMLPEKCEIVEIATGYLADNHWTINQLLLGAYNGIPPEASAKHHISNRMIDGKLPFDKAISAIKHLLDWEHSSYFIAHNAKYDRAALKTSFLKYNFDDDAKICDDDSRWICTWRLSKHILQHSFTDIQYGLEYLRYKLDLTVDDSVGSHRAGDDTLVCIALLNTLIELACANNQLDINKPIGPQLNALCWSYIPITTWPFGKHKGTLLTDLDNSYYAWALKNMNSLNEDSNDFDIDLTESIKQVLTARFTQ